MSKKDKFVEMVEGLFAELEEIDQDVLDYFETVKQKKTTKREEMTDNGKAIIGYMQDTYEETDNKFLSKDIAEGLFTSSRSVSGAMRKLVTDGYVDKNDDSPIVYSLTDLGKEYSI
jgi:DNA-binding MarR family transcriptional regulator